MPIKDPIRRREYQKAYSKAHKEKIKEYDKAYKKAHKEQIKEYWKAWKEMHKEECIEYQKLWYQANKESVNTYNKLDLNSFGQTKTCIRKKSQRYLKKYGTKIEGYEIHHCCSYSEPYKFIYCPIEMHKLIHKYLREHNIDADSNHYEQIKHLLDDTVVIYGIE